MACRLLMVRVRVAAGVDLDLRAVDGDDADLDQPRARAQQQDLAEHSGQHRLVTLDEPRDRRVMGRCCAATTRKATSSMHPRSMTRDDRIPRAYA